MENRLVKWCAACVLSVVKNVSKSFFISSVDNATLNVETSQTFNRFSVTVKNGLCKANLCREQIGQLLFEPIDGRCCFFLSGRQWFSHLFLGVTAEVI